MDQEPVSHTDSYSFTPDKEELVPNQSQVKEFLGDNFLEAPIRLNKEVIRESLSPEYDAF